MRLGLASGLLMYVVTNWNETKLLWIRPRASVLALIKEPFGVAIAFLTEYALANAEVTVASSIRGLDSVGIFVVRTVLAYFGLVPESIRARDLVQKGVGAIAMVAGNILLLT